MFLIIVGSLPDFYRTPLYSDTGAAEDDVLSQFKKRTVNKFKSAFAYYSLTYKLAHLQQLLFLDMMLNKDSVGTAGEEADTVSKGNSLNIDLLWICIKVLLF